MWRGHLEFGGEGQLGLQWEHCGILKRLFMHVGLIAERWESLFSGIARYVLCSLLLPVDLGPHSGSEGYGTHMMDAPMVMEPVDVERH